MFTIRKATVADCELIHKMAKEVFPATYKEILSPEQLDYMMDWMYAPSNVRKQMEEEGHVYSIAYKENEPCGYVSIQQQEKDVFHLQKIYVLPRFQGRISVCILDGILLYIAFERGVGYYECC
jgi:diamine N-acetyltransferase